MSWERWFHDLMHNAGSYGYEPMPTPVGQPYGMPPGMHTGASYPMPGILGGLPAWGAPQQAPFQPAPATFSVNPHPSPDASAHAGYPQGTPTPWMENPDAHSDQSDRRPPPAPYRYQPMHPAAMPAGVPMAAPYAHPYGEDRAHSMQGVHYRAGFPPRPSDYESQWSAEIIRDFRPPKDTEEEREQLQFAITRSRYDTSRRPIETFLDHLDKHASSTQPARPVPLSEQPRDIQELYQNETQYLEEMTASLMNHAPVEEALKLAGMHVVPNDGVTPEGKNNCFLISLAQHKARDYDSQHPIAVDLGRRVLNGDLGARIYTLNLSQEHARLLINARDFNLDKDARFASGSTAARLAVDLLNANQKDEDKLDVWIVSMVDGKPYIDKLESGSPSARVVCIWDKGGHFEAITSTPEGPVQT